MRTAAIAALALAAAAPSWAADCAPHPLGGRELFLRGSFNSWTAPEAQRFVWACDRFELVTRIDGEHRFKIGDESWNADADLGRRADRAATAAGAWALAPRGPELSRRFDGTTRFVLSPDLKSLRIEACPKPAPFGDTVLYLRGTMNHWAASDDDALRYHCDAYLLNVKLVGRNEFKIADAAWAKATSFGVGGAGAPGNHVVVFTGEHTVRLAFDEAGQASVTVGPKTFADPGAAAVADPVARSLAFDSRDAAHKMPFGAIVPGTTVDYAVTALPGVARLTLVVELRRLEGSQDVLEYTELARVPMTRVSNQDGRERWTARRRFDAIGVYGVWFEAEIGGRRYALHNNRDPVPWTREKGSGGRAVVDELAPTTQAARSVRRLRQTVYAADFRVPDWAADAVYYYIFPERFRNGDKRNDPVPGRDRVHRHTVEKHPRWIGRPWRPGSGDGSDAHYNNDFFGGDLAGIIDKLDHIAALGANVLYLTPIFRAASNHKYDTADYHQVDPAFGTNADVERLTREAGRRGIRVVLDASFNHTGADSRYFDRFGNFDGIGAFEGGRIRPDSPYASWYSFDPSQTEPDKQYRGWVGVTDLPELDKASRSWRSFAYGAPDSVTKTWLDRGTAGWRMDVAPWVPEDFWREWRAAVKAHRPEAITIAETWFDAAHQLLGDQFDSTMNYIFRNAVLDYAGGGDARPTVANLELMREHYPPQALHALMNLLSSHDQARALHVLGWHDDGDAAQAALAKARYRLALLIQMTYPGAPAIYYGDEVGLTGGEDPDNRRPFPWADEGGAPDEILHAEFRRLTALRHAQPILRRGTLGAPLHVDRQVIVLPRRLDGRLALTAFNNAERPLTIKLPLPPDAPSSFDDALDGSTLRAEDGQLALTLPPRFGRVLIGR